MVRLTNKEEDNDNGNHSEEEDDSSHYDEDCDEEEDDDDDYEEHFDKEEVDYSNARETKADDKWIKNLIALKKNHTKNHHTKVTNQTAGILF